MPAFVGVAKIVSQTPGARVVEWNAYFVTASGAQHFSASGYRLTEAAQLDGEGKPEVDHSPAARALLAVATTQAEYRAAIDADAARLLAEFEAREVPGAQQQTINLIG